MIIGIALIWVAFFSVGNMPSWLDFRPFNCITCLSFWTCLVAYLLETSIPETKTIITALEWGGIGAFIGTIGKRLIFRI